MPATTSSTVAALSPSTRRRIDGTLSPYLARRHTAHGARARAAGARREARGSATRRSRGCRSASSRAAGARRSSTRPRCRRWPTPSPGSPRCQQPTRCRVRRRRSARARLFPIRRHSPARTSASAEAASAGERPARRRGRSMLPARARRPAAACCSSDSCSASHFSRETCSARVAMRSSRALHRRAYGRIPYARSSAAPSTAPEMAIVRRSRGSSTGLCSEREREALVGLAAFAIARGSGEKASVGETRVAVERREDRRGIRRRPIDAPLVADRTRVQHGDVARKTLAKGGENAKRVGARGRHVPRRSRPPDRGRRVVPAGPPPALLWAPARTARPSSRASTSSRERSSAQSAEA